jgi:hypothetical protein
MQTSSFCWVLEFFRMTRLHNFLPGDHIALLYPSVGANRHLGTVIEVTAASISVHIDGLLRTKQFHFSRKGRWFSERGHMVSIGCAPSETARNLLEDSPHGSTALFEIATPPHSYDVAITPEIERALADHDPVAIGVSGGKDSSAVAIRTFDYLDDCGHRGPRLLIHCDLGEVEWLESLPTCERLAVSLGTELLVLRRRRPAGGSAGKTTNNGTPSWNAFASFCRGVRLPLGSVRAS